MNKDINGNELLHCQKLQAKLQLKFADPGWHQPLQKTMVPSVSNGCSPHMKS